MKVRTTISARKLLATILLVSGCTFPIYGEKKNSTPSDTPVVRAKVSCKAQFTKFKNKASSYPDDDTTGIFVDVPDIYSGWKITYGKWDKPLEFEVKKAGIVTVATPQAVTRYLRSDGWKEVGIFYTQCSNTQFDKKWTSLIFEKYLSKGEHQLKENMEGPGQPRLLKRN
jgi:hypothetical protein